MVRGDTIEFENDIPTKHKAKKTSFYPEEKVESYLRRNVT